MAKILLTFFNGVNDPSNDNAMLAFYESFISELSKTGHTLLVYHHKNFSQNWEEWDSNIEDEILNFSPDFAIVFDNLFYDFGEKFDFPVIIYLVNSVLYLGNLDKVLTSPNRYLFVSSKNEDLEFLKKHNVNDSNLLLLPFFTSFRNEKIDKLQNIVYIGTKFNLAVTSTHVSEWDKFTKTQPCDMSKQIYRNLVDFILTNPFCSHDELCEKFNNKFFDVSKISLREMIDNLSASKCVTMLSSISDLGLTIYGDIGGGYYNSDEWHMPLCYDSSLAYSIEQQQRVYNTSKIAPNVNHVQAISSFSWRVYDIMATDSCLVSEYNPALNNILKEVPIPTFSNPYDAREKIKYILNNENYRKEIVHLSNEYVEKNCRFKNILDGLESLLGIDLHNLNERFSTVNIYQLDKRKVELINAASSLKLLKKSLIPSIDYKLMFPVYRFGDKVYCTKNSESKTYIHLGLSYPEDNFTWTAGKNVVFKMTCVGKKIERFKYVKFTMDAICFNNLQRVIVSSHNFKDEYTLSSNDNTIREFTIPITCIRNDNIEIFINLPDAKSPLADNGDKRELGLAIKWFSLDLLK